MHLGRLTRLTLQGAGIVLLASALTLAACGKGSSSGAGASKALTLASELPTTGDDAGDGLPTQNGVELAVSQNTDLGNGYTLKFEAKNDVSTSTNKHDPQTGASNLTALASDSSVMAVVGPFNSGVAVAEIPIANQSTLTLISPANTNPGLTIQQYAAANNINFAQLHPAGLPNCYFRIPGTDVVQGALLADIALTPVASANKPAYKKVYIIDDNETYGVGLANFFQAEFTSPQNNLLKGQGGTVLGHDSIGQDQASQLQTLAAKIKAAKPDFVFYGGVTSNGAGTLKADLGPSVVMEGGDGIADDPSWLTAAGSGAPNTFGTVAAPDIGSLTGSVASGFISAYKAKYNSAPIPYSASAYDAAGIEIAAIKSLISSGKSVTRANVCAAVQATQYMGATGSISFDQNGDNAGAKVYSVFRTSPDGKSWIFQQQVSVNS